MIKGVVGKVGGGGGRGNRLYLKRIFLLRKAKMAEGDNS